MLDGDLTTGQVHLHGGPMICMPVAVFDKYAAFYYEWKDLVDALAEERQKLETEHADRATEGP